MAKMQKKLPTKVSDMPNLHLFSANCQKIFYNKRKDIKGGIGAILVNYWTGSDPMYFVAAP